MTRVSLAFSLFKIPPPSLRLNSSVSPASCHAYQALRKRYAMLILLLCSALPVLAFWSSWRNPHSSLKFSLRVWSPLKSATWANWLLLLLHLCCVLDVEVILDLWTLIILRVAINMEQGKEHRF